MSRRKQKESKKKSHSIFKIFAILSTLIAIAMCVLLYILDMVPIEYLIIIYSFLAVIYIIFLLLTFIRKVSTGVKAFCLIIFLLFDIIFGFGIKYVGKTISFVDLINNQLFQNEEYYLMVLSDSNFTSLSDIKGKSIGVYQNNNSTEASKKLASKITFNSIDYTNIEKMLTDISEEKISAILINNAIKNLIINEFSNLELNLKEIYKLNVTLEEKNIVKSVDVTKESFNIFVAGGDSYGNISNVTNTDVNMVISLNPQSKEILLTSIPRDYYVNLSSFGEDAYDKLTHAGYYGIEESISAVEKLLDTEINYYVKVNFSTIEGLVDSIEGIEVYSDYDFCVTNAPNVCFQKGNNNLDGYHALMFARERYSFKNGDVQRIKNQQKVLTAIIDKITSSSSFITNFSNILDNLGSSFATNMDSKSISNLVKMQLSDMPVWTIESQNLTGTDYYTTDTYTYPGTKLYVMKMNPESVEVSSTKIREILN